MGEIVERVAQALEQALPPQVAAELACDAIAVIRDPTPQMPAAGWAKIRGGRERVPFLLTPGPGFAEAHRSMIDKALG